MVGKPKAQELADFGTGPQAEIFPLTEFSMDLIQFLDSFGHFTYNFHFFFL